MPHLFLSANWAHALRHELNASERYAQAGVDWTHGPVSLVALDDPSGGGEWAILLDVHGGECRAATYLPAPEARRLAPFVVEGKYGTWAELLRSGDDPIRALMQGRLKLTKGSLATMIRYVESSKALLKCAQQVDSTFVEPG